MVFNNTLISGLNKLVECEHIHTNEQLRQKMKDYYSLRVGRLYFWIIIVFFPFGLLFYDYLGLTYIDEIIALFLALYWLKSKGITREMKILAVVFVSYLLYSLFVTRINGYIAPFYDLQQQIKPYIVILATLSLKPQFTKSQIKIIKKEIILCAIVLFFIYLNGMNAMRDIIKPPTCATTSLTLGLLYLYLSDKSKTSVIISTAIILCGIFSMRSKLFGEVCVFIGVYFFLKNRIKKINLKYIIYSIALLTCIIYFAWEKFNFYFIEGFSDEDTFLARPILYKTAWEILCDYVPFGSGLGTFADEASRVFYSPIYTMYGINNVWGLREAEGARFAADTFFPILAQYGFAGIILFLMFWRYIYIKVKLIPDFSNYKIGLILLASLFIESTTDSSMLSNRGVIIMMLLAFCCNSYTLCYVCQQKDGNKKSSNKYESKNYSNVSATVSSVQRE